MTKETQSVLKTSASTVQDPWGDLKQFTRARIALGRVGSSLPTKEILNFGMSHAMARDAVHLALDIDTLQSQIESLGVEVLKLHSRAPDRASYLLRPDWGRRLADLMATSQRSYAWRDDKGKMVCAIEPLRASRTEFVLRLGLRRSYVQEALWPNG